MTFVVEITPNNGGEIKYHVCKGSKLSIGRGFAADIILNDPYVDELHAELSDEEGKFILRDNGSLNGIELNGTDFKFGVVKAGEKIRIGSSELRILPAGYKMPPALKMERDNARLLSWLGKPYILWLALAAGMASMQFWSFFSIWTDERPMAVAATAGAVLGVIMLWSILWSVASRLAKSKSNFSAHMSIVSFYVSVSVILWYVLSYIDFFLNENLAATLLGYGINGLCLAGLIYVSLLFTNNQTSRKNMLSSLIFAFGVICGIITINYIQAQQFSLTPSYSAQMEPYMTSLVPTDAVDEFMKENKLLFATETFKAAKL